MTDRGPIFATIDRLRSYLNAGSSRTDVWLAAGVMCIAIFLGAMFILP